MNKRRSDSSPAIRGTALMTVMFIICIATSIMALMLWRDELNIRRTQNLLNDAQAQQYALGGETMAIQLLSEDARRLKENNATPWPSLQASLPVDDGSIAFMIEDMDARFNINSLAGGVQSLADSLQRLLDQLNVTPGLAKHIVSTLSARQEQVDNLTILRKIPGMTEAQYDRMEKYLTALPSNGWALNVNTASDSVLKAFVPDEKMFKILKDNRDRHQAISSPDLGLMGITDTMLSSASRYFRVTVRALFNGREVVLSSIIRRGIDGSGGSHLSIISRDTSKTF